MSKLTYKAVLLDLDDTLYAYSPCNKAGEEAAFKLAMDLTGKSIKQIEEQFGLARKHVHKTLHGTAASHNRLLYFHKMTELLGVQDLRVPLRLYNAFWDTFLDTMEPRPGVMDFLETAGNAKFCLLTDLTAHIQFRKLKKLGLDTRIPLMVTSEEIGREKPHEDGFLLALQKCDTAPNRACMIGDNRVKDAEAAVALGIDSFWYTESPTPITKGITPFNDFYALTNMIIGSS